MQYLHHSELQKQWACRLLGQYHFTGKERVLDFGSGDGKISAQISYYVPKGSVTGVDLSESMVELASLGFPSAYYPNPDEILEYEGYRITTPERTIYDVFMDEQTPEDFVIQAIREGVEKGIVSKSKVIHMIQEANIDRGARIINNIEEHDKAVSSSC